MSMRRYFRLASDCILVQDGKNGVIYAVSEGRIYLLDHAAYQLVSRAERNEPLDESSIGTHGRRLFEWLRDNSLGFFDDEPAYVDRLSAFGATAALGMDPRAPLIMHQVDWTITSRCARSCAFCPRGPATVVSQACMTCVRQRGTSESTNPVANLASRLDEVVDLGTRVLHIRGGDPFAVWDRLTTLVQAASSKFGLAVTTPGLGRSEDEIAAFSAANGLRLNLVILADDIADALADGPSDIFSRQMSVLDALAREQVSFGVTCIVSSNTARETEPLTQFIAARWNTTPAFSEVFEASATGSATASVFAAKKQLTGWNSLGEWFIRSHRNKCLFGRCELGLDGRIHPCAGLDACGKAAGDDRLAPVIAASELRDWWMGPSERLKGCSKCNLRYGCHPCTAAALHTAENGRPQCCPLDPADEIEPAALPWRSADSVRTIRLETSTS
ncbi:MAG TPA: radical SAM protein [Vicinamibacterales bacterium]|nr:radical SAM protein [Vicinamibacterales bacterium]